MRELEDHLPQIRAAWMAGRSAVEHCPPTWRAALGDGSVAETAIAGLAGHAIQALFRPTPPAGLSPRPLLPRLPAALLPTEARRHFLRILASVRATADATRMLVLLMMARGYALHPADWMPGPRDEWVPPLYAPWLAWASADARADPNARLTVETYDSWSWTERRNALAELRSADPEAARIIIAAKVAGESAEHRLRLAELFAEHLEDADTPLLERFLEDRSERVKVAARLLLARLGRGGADPALATELACMLQLGRIGLLRRRTRIELKPLKTHAEEQRRLQLLGTIGLPALAKALDTPEDALLESMPTGEADAVAAFIEQVAQTGSDAACRTLLEHILADADASLGLAIPLSPRLTGATRAVMLPRVLERDDSSAFGMSILFAGETLGTVPEAHLSRSAGCEAVADLVRDCVGDDAVARARAEPVLNSTLRNLGLLLDAAAARRLIDTCTAAGLSDADPRLDLLRLNASLNEEQSL